MASHGLLETILQIKKHDCWEGGDVGYSGFTTNSLGFLHVVDWSQELPTIEFFVLQKNTTRPYLQYKEKQSTWTVHKSNKYLMTQHVEW